MQKRIIVDKIIASLFTPEEISIFLEKSPYVGRAPVGICM
jgi:hypothetical protein